MPRSNAFRWTVVGALCASFLAPSSSYAFCCDWFKKQPAAPALACNACAPVQQTVSYQPQTCYRTQYCTVPVTTFRPAWTFDPCSGCPVSAMRPCTTYVQQARLVPYNTYRLVYSNPCSPCAPAVATASYAPAIGCGSCGTATPAYAASPARGCTGCGQGAVTYAAPALSTPVYAAPAAAVPTYNIPGSTAPAYTQPAYTQPAYTQPAYTQPAYTQPAYTQPLGGSTYSNPAGTIPTYSAPTTPSYGPPTSVPSLSPTPGSVPAATPSNTLKPIPDTNINGGSRVNPTSSPRLIDPDTRTTSIPVYRPWAYSAVAWPKTPAAAATVQTDSSATVAIRPVSAVAPREASTAKPAVRPAAKDDGWRASDR